MLTAKRACAIAVLLLTAIILYKTSHPTDASPPSIRNVHSPRPTGSYQENRVLGGRLPTTDVAPASPIDITPSTKQPTVNINRPRPQVPLQDARSRSLEEQLAYIYPYDETADFPAYIWQTWRTTPEDKDFPKDFRLLEQLWTERHPGFIHEVITDEIAMHLISHFYSAVPEVIEAYNALPLPVLKADFFRYLILLARGGIYSDIDTAPIQSAVDWVPVDVDRSTYGLVIGLEADPDRPDWKDWYSRRIQFCQWTIQAKMGHPVLRSVVAQITHETLRRQKAAELGKHFDRNSVIEFTGPAIWTDTIFDYFNDPVYFETSKSGANITWAQFTGMKTARKLGDVVVLPITSFSPGIKQMGAGEDDDPMAFVKHLFDGTFLARLANDDQY